VTVFGNYEKLGAAFYDFEKGFADEGEVDFFERLIRGNPGPALEAMCGSGRILIPLLKRKCAVEGLDNSRAMLANLARRSQEAGLLPPVTHRQSVINFELIPRYSLIFITLGSFQLIPPGGSAQVLSQVHRHLMPGGKFILDTFIPWQLIGGEFPLSTQRKALVGGRTIYSASQISLHPEEQRYEVQNNYHRGSGFYRREREHFSVYWYFPQQLAPTLSAAGFSVEVQPVPLLGEVKRRYVYHCTKE
jgi:SAM-dependent methyltransferase